MFNLSTNEKVLSLTNHLSIFSSILMKNTDSKSVNSLNIYDILFVHFEECSTGFFYLNSKKANEAHREVKLLIFLCLYEAASISHFNSFAVLQRVLVATSACAARTHCVENQTHSFPPINCRLLLQEAHFLLPEISSPSHEKRPYMKWQNLGAMTTGSIKIQLNEPSSHFNRALKNFLNFKRTSARLSHSFWHVHTAS